MATTITPFSSPTSQNKPQWRLRLYATHFPKQTRGFGLVPPDTVALITSIGSPHDSPRRRSVRASFSRPHPNSPSEASLGTSDGSPWMRDDNEGPSIDFSPVMVPPTLAPIDGSSNSHLRTSSFSSVAHDENEQQHEQLCGQTEIVRRSCNPQWVTTFDMDYHLPTNSNEQQANGNQDELFFSVQVLHCSQPESSSENDQEGPSPPTSAVRQRSKLRLSLRMRQGSDNGLARSVSFGSALFEVGDILRTKHQTRVKRLKSGGSIYCTLQAIPPGEPARLFISAAAVDLKLSRSKSLILGLAPTIPETRLEVASRPLRVTESDHHLVYHGGWVIVHRSLPVPPSLDPQFDPIVIDFDTIGRNFHQPLRLSVYEVKPNECTRLIGMTETTPWHLLQTSKTSLEEGEVGNGPSAAAFLLLQRSESKVDNVGRLRISHASLISDTGVQLPVPETPTDLVSLTESTSQAEAFIPRGSFDSIDQDDDDEQMESKVDLKDLVPVAPPIRARFKNYLDHGCEIDFCVAIDFTSSNGDPRYASSLHYQGYPEFLNDYEETIIAIGSALTAYTGSQEYCLWGFGAKFDGVIRHIFQCGSQATVHGVDGILAAYRSVFQNDLTMSGPTEYLQVLQKAAWRARRNHESKTPTSTRYTILLCITDGCMSNFDETARLLEMFIPLPLSVIFVGVGRHSADFGLMYQLCQMTTSNPRALPVDQSYPKATFVEFRHHQHNLNALGEAALQLLPFHVCEYMRIHQL